MSFSWRMEIERKSGECINSRTKLTRIAKRHAPRGVKAETKRERTRTEEANEVFLKKPLR